MILKRVEKNGIVKAIYNSSNVLASKYDKANQELTVTFKTGSVYTYAGVPDTDYTRLEISESQGKVLNSVIKKYPVTKGADVDTAAIIAEVTKIQEEELKELEAAIVKLMDNTSSTYNKKGVMDMASLTKLQFMISKYQHEKNV